MDSRLTLAPTDMRQRYNTASVYFDWALHEGQPGTYTASGVFDLALFLQVAKEAGMFIIAVGRTRNVFSESKLLTAVNM